MRCSSCAWLRLLQKKRIRIRPMQRQLRPLLQMGCMILRQMISRRTAPRHGTVMMQGHSPAAIMLAAQWKTVIQMQGEYQTRLRTACLRVSTMWSMQHDSNRNIISLTTAPGTLSADKPCCHIWC